MDSEWSEWFEHDGKGCPCVGRWVEIRSSEGHRAEGVATRSPCWTWPRSGADRWRVIPIIRFRIRQPRALQQLREIANLRETVDA